MKKLIFAAAAVAGMGAFALESANVVGYNTGATGSNNNFVTIPFADIGYNTADIQAIKLSDGGAGTIGYGTEMFSVWEGVPTVASGSEFFYYDPMMDPNAVETDYYWGDASYAKAAYSIAPGQAVVINCPEGLEVKTSGEVSDEQVSFTTIQNNNFTGNPFPATIDIQAIKLSDGGVGAIGYGTEMFSVWEGVPTVAAGSEFFFYDPMMDPNATETDYYWGDASYAKAAYSIAPGQGVVINCPADLTVTIKAPFSISK